jgi:hypothetical protein
MGLRYYILTVKTSHNSATAFSLNADCDADAVGKALCVIKKLDAFCDRPPFQIARTDGTVLRDIARQDRSH